MLAHKCTDLVERVLDEEPSDSVVHLNVVPRSSWYLDGRSLNGATGVHLEVSITANTNTAEQKADFLRDAYKLITAHIPDPADAVYVALYELNGNAYGSNGISQQARALLSPAGRD